MMFEGLTFKSKSPAGSHPIPSHLLYLLPAHMDSRHQSDEVFQEVQLSLFGQSARDVHIWTYKSEYEKTYVKQWICENQNPFEPLPLIINLNNILKNTSRLKMTHKVKLTWSTKLAPNNQ